MSLISSRESFLPLIMALLYARLTVELSGVSRRARLGSARPFVPADALRGSNSGLDERWVFQCPWVSRRLARRLPVDPAPGLEAQHRGGNHANSPLSNQVLLHVHGHDQAHTHDVNVNDPGPEAPDDGKLSPPVLNRRRGERS